jgi:hypothetical protein
MQKSPFRLIDLDRRIDDFFPCIPCPACVTSLRASGPLAGIVAMLDAQHMDRYKGGQKGLNYGCQNIMPAMREG